ncbi:hypothetical protein N0V82_006599 [Gnomoniopsis sp. IMI 355080]|nr:hypothetical protein N0V82_006599 [Gnomoniopsis sp. IMI 355080]
MKLIAYLLLLLSAVMGIAAVDVQKSFLVYFNDDAPESAMSQAKQKILDAKGSITHEYRLLKGFAATAGEKIFESLQVTGQSNGFTVEEDQTFKINSGS